LRRDVTVKEIASALGLSQPAVSQVLNGTGRISAQTRQRVLATAETMGYRPNASARAVVTRKTRQVGVLVLNNPSDPATFPHTYYTILGMNMALEAAGYVLCLVRLGDVEQSIEGHSRVFREHVLDGVIVTTQLPARLSARIQELVPRCVWADTNEWEKTRCIRRDEFDVGRRVGEQVVAAGYKEIIYLSEMPHGLSPLLHYSHIDRGEGLASVCSDAGVTFRTIQTTWNWTQAFSDRLNPQLRPDVAVVTSDTFRARLVQQSAALGKLLIGRDFGLACCDLVGDVTSTWPDLSGMLFDRIELGGRSAEMMLAILEGSDQEPASVALKSAWYPGTTLAGR